MSSTLEQPPLREGIQSTDIVPPQEPVANVLYRKRLREWAIKSEANRKWILDKCKKDYYFWLESFSWLYEPRPETGRAPIIPFIPWPHQRPIMDTILHPDNFGKRDMGIEKARGEGATWMCLMILLWRWIFHPMQAFGIVSRNEATADNPDDPDSLGAKLDWALTKMPTWMIGRKGVDWRRNVSKHTWINIRNGSTITAYPSTGDLASGGRKANSLDTKILTPNGWVTMGDLKVGSIITGANGKPTEVLGVYPLGKRQVYRVTFSDGSSTECCDEHLWSVKARGWKNWKVRQLKDIKKDYTPGTYTSGSPRYKYQIPLLSSPAEFNPQHLKIDPYLLGVLIGDGCITNRALEFASDDQQIVDEVRSRLPYQYYMHKSRPQVYKLRIHDGCEPVLHGYLKEYGLYGKRAWEKHLPEEYLRASVQDRLSLLRGLMDTDGNVVRNSKAKYGCVGMFNTTSKQLARDITELVQTLGGLASTSECEAGYKKDGVYRRCRNRFSVSIRLPSEMNPFLLQRKAELIVPRTVRLTRSIVNIEPAGVEEVQCIRVSASDSLYVCDDCIVTHNTAFFCDEMSKFPRGEDEDALAATEPVTNCRLLVSTYNGADGAYYRAMMEQENDQWIKLRLRWTDNPYRSVDKFVIDGKNQQLLDPVTHEPLASLEENGYKNLFYEEYYQLLVKRGFIVTDTERLLKKVWSPWYVSRCLRPRMTPQKIAQEYDMDPIGSGNRFFPGELIEDCLDKCRQPTFTGDIEYDLERLKITRIFKSSTGLFRTWLPTQGGHWAPPPARYIVGCDVAQGLGTDHSSNSAVSVINRDTGEKVAEFASTTVLPEKLAELAIAICRFFKTQDGSPAYLIWEANGPGGAFRERIMSSVFRNVYYRTAYKTRRGKPSKEMGWWSVGAAKVDLLTRYRWALQEGFFQNPSEIAVREAGQYVTVGANRLEYISGSADEIDPTDAKENHGDRCIADAVANLAMEHLGGGAAGAEAEAVAKRTPKPLEGTFLHRRMLAMKKSQRRREDW